MKILQHSRTTTLVVIIILFNNFFRFVQSDFTICDHIVLLKFYEDTKGLEWKNNTGWTDYIQILRGNEWIVQNNRVLTANTVPNYILIDHFNNYIKYNSSNLEEINRDLKESNLNICKSLYGVKCNSNDDLIGLELQDNGLKGNIPEYIPFLYNLEILNLTNNQIRGKIPGFLFQITKKLKIVDLSFNLLSDEIPIVRSESLTILKLNNNRLSKYLTTLWNATKLEIMNLSNNKLSGSIPKLLFKNELRSLDISNNLYVGYVPILTKSKLEYFNFSYNRLMDNITFSSLWKSNLLVIDGESNQFIGTIPNNVLDYTAITYINLKKNLLTPIVPSVVACSNITVEISPNSPDEPVERYQCQPKILESINIDPDGGTLTIKGHDFGTSNDIKITFSLSNQICSNVKMIKVNRDITCDYPPGLTQGPITLNFMSNGLVTSSKTRYYAPNITNLSKLNKNQSGKITITGKYLSSLFTDPLLIGGYNCTNPTYSNDKSSFTCDFEGKDLIMPAPVTYYNLRDRYFYYNEEETQDIECSSPTSYDDFIIIRSSRFDLSKVAEVYVDDKKCLNMTKSSSNLTVSTTNNEVRCLPDKLVSGTNNKVTLVISDDRPYFKRCLTYPPPQVSSILGVTYEKGGIVKIIGKNLKGRIKDTSVEIGNRVCCALYDYMPDDNFQCYLQAYSEGEIEAIKNQSLSILNQPVTISISGQKTTIPNIYSDLDGICKDTCVKHHTQSCQSGTCECYPNFVGPFCERDIPSTGIEFSNLAPKISFQYPHYITEYSFDVGFSEIIEFSDKFSQTKFTYEPLNWLLKSWNETYREFQCQILPNYYKESKNPEQHQATIIVRVDYSENHRYSYFSGEMISIPKKSARYSVEIRNWKFRSNTDKLQLIFELTAPSKALSPCLPKPTIKSSDLPLRWLTMSISDITLYAKVPQRALIDGLVRNIISSTTTTNDIETIKMCYGIPHFLESSKLEMDFSAMMEENFHAIQKQDGCFIDKSKKFPDIKLILFFVSLVFILIMVALIIQCSRVESRERKKLLETFPIKNELLSSPQFQYPLNHPLFNILNFDLDNQNQINSKQEKQLQDLSNDKNK